MATPKLNFLSIFERNTKGPYVQAVMDKKVIGISIFMGFLPQLITIFVISIKSLIDYFTRKPLSEQKLDRVVNELENLSDDKVSALVELIISQYPSPKSNSSKELLSTLESRRRLWGKQLEEIAEHHDLPVASLRNRIREAEENQTATSENIAKAKAKLPEIEEKHAQEKKIELAEKQKQFRDSIINDLFCFFKAGHNTGKRMQHVIADTVSTINL